MTADVRKPPDAERVVAKAVEHFGRLDVLINNAGGSPHVLAADASPRFVEAIVNLNLLAPLWCAQSAHKVMAVQEDGGSIVNITSVSGMRPSPGASAYGAAKAGLLNLTTTLAVEWAPLVRVNCVTGGLLDTGAGDDFYGGPEAMARGPPPCRWGGWARRPTSPTPACSCPARRRPTSRAPTWSSTAAGSPRRSWARWPRTERPVRRRLPAGWFACRRFHACGAR